MPVTFSDDGAKVVTPSELPTGTLVKDKEGRIFMVIRKPETALVNDALVRLSSPLGYYGAEATAPFTLYNGTVIIENDSK